MSQRPLAVQAPAHDSTHRPEPHILLFRRPLGTDPVTGKVNPELEREAKERYQADMGAARK